MGSKNSTLCKKCGTDPRDDYDNPVLVIHHIGKYDKSSICHKCYMNLVNRQPPGMKEPKNTTKKYKVK